MGAQMKLRDLVFASNGRINLEKLRDLFDFEGRIDRRQFSQAWLALIISIGPMFELASSLQPLDASNSESGDLIVADRAT